MKRISVIALTALAFCAVASAQPVDTLWTRAYAGPGANANLGRAVATIGTDIYVAGQEMITEPNVFVVKYLANGDTAWARTFNLDTMEQPVDIVVGSDSGPVVCVSILGPTPAFRVIKLNKAGDTVWTHRRNGVQATNLAMDDDGNVFVFGAAFGTMPMESLYLSKYTLAGAQDWQKTFDLGDNHQTAGACCDDAGNVYGAVNVNTQGGPFSGCIKFSPSGDTILRVSPMELNGTIAQAVAVDRAGFILLGAARGAEYVVARCSTNGRFSWQQPVPGIQPPPEAYNTLATDSDTNVVVGGAGGQMGMVVKLAQNGQPLWTGNSMVMGAFFGVAVDAEKRPVLVGVGQVAPPPCLTMKFTGIIGVEEGGRSSVRPAAASATVIGPGSSVSVQVPKAGTYKVALYDARGAVVQQLHNGSLSAGGHNFTVSQLAAGQYYLKVTGKSGTVESKLVQVR